MNCPIIIWKSVIWRQMCYLWPQANQDVSVWDHRVSEQSHVALLLCKTPSQPLWPSLLKKWFCRHYVMVKGDVDIWTKEGSKKLYSVRFENFVFQYKMFHLLCNCDSLSRLVLASIWLLIAKNHSTIGSKNGWCVSSAWDQFIFASFLCRNF